MTEVISQAVERRERKAGMANGRSPILHLDNVRKIYRMGSELVYALDGISLDIHEGSFWAIMGPSGSGKSTMLNILGCLDRPTTGRYMISGHDISRMNDDELSRLRLKNLGFIFQNFNLIAELTVRENIELPLFYLGWDSRESAQRAAELAERIGLGDRLRHRPAELSGGQQQRVAIGRALANDPNVILADEPTGNLDSVTGRHIMELLGELNSQGRTIVIVTHEAEVASWADHRLHMLDGKVDRID